MNALIANSTGSSPLSTGNAQLLFEVGSGPYAGRQVVIFQESASTLSYAAAIAPYRTWTPPLVIAADMANTPYAAVMASNGDIFVTYTEQSAQDLVVCKLTFSNGAWTVGSPVVVNNSLQSYEPTIAIDKNGTIWIAYHRYSAPTRTLFVKSSVDNGATWGSGPIDPGSALGPVGQFISSKLLATSTSLGLAYAIDGSHVGLRVMPLTTGVWGDEQVAVSSVLVTTALSMAQGSDGGIGIVYVAAGVYYRRFDGVLFGSPQLIDSLNSTRVYLTYRENIPIVLYTLSRGTDQYDLLSSHASSGVFSVPVSVDPRSSTAKTVLLYDLSAASFVDRTTAALTGGSGDITHPSSGVTFRDTGDALFLGMDQPFRSVHVLLSTLGVGGTIGYRYWNGSLWQGFTPAAGTIDFTTLSNHVSLWDDYAQIPADWQRHSVNGIARFWLKIEVLSTYATAPVANQITALSDITGFTGRG